MNDPMGGDAPQIQRKKPGPKPGAKRKSPGRPPLVPPQARRTIEEDEAYTAAPVRRNAPRPPSRPEASRDTVREPSRSGGIVVAGRGGEQLTRRRTSVGDKYHLDTSEVPPGWSYQWNPVTVLGQGINEIVNSDLTMHENGWRAVPSTRFAGRWTPHGHVGDIVVDGLRLEERPLSLTIEAKEEDTARAKALIRDRTDALRMTQKQLPGANVARARGQAGEMRMSIDPGLDIPVPQHQLDDGS
jgi:hypothetical protein